MTHRKKNEDALLLALACGATVEAAARQCGIHERTVYRRMKDPDFRRSLEKIRGEMIGRASGLLTAASLEAVKTLLDLQKSNVAAPTRLAAARAVLEIGLKIRTEVDLQQQMEELFRRIDLANAARHPTGMPPRSVIGELD